MKFIRTYFLLTVLFLATSFSCSRFSPIFDHEGILTVKQEKELTLLYKNHYKKTTNQFALVTSADLDGYEDIQAYATDFGNNHGVGETEKDNGIVIAFSQSQRKVAIATGLKMEHILKDEIAKAIIDTAMIPCFKQGKSYEGLLAGSHAIIQFLEKPKTAEPFKGTLKF